MGRSPCCKKEGLNRGAWTAIEDKILSDYITAHGDGRWRSIPRESGLKRCGKSCRLRWLNYLRPDIKRGNITPEEEDLIVRLHKLLGNRWSLIAGRLPGRTDNEIKNYWNTTLGKKAKGEKEKVTKRRDDGVNKSAIVARSDVAVRTKARRCTKKFMLMSSDPEPTSDPMAGLRAVNKGEGSPMTTSEAVDLDKLAMDSSTRELLLTDMSDSDFWKFCQFDGILSEDGNGNGNGNENFDDLVLFEESIKNWSNEDDFLQYLI